MSSFRRTAPIEDTKQNLHNFVTVFVRVFKMRRLKLNAIRSKLTCNRYVGVGSAKITLNTLEQIIKVRYLGVDVTVIGSIKATALMLRRRPRNALKDDVIQILDRTNQAFRRMKDVYM